MFKALAASGKIRNPEKVAFVTQTTLSVDDAARVVESLQKAFPQICPPRKDDICYATTNRQNAVKEIAPNVKVFIVVGSKASSNAHHLREVAGRLGAESYLIDDANAVDGRWFEPQTRIAVNAGASTLQHLVDEVLAQLHVMFHNGFTLAGGESENVQFRLPLRFSGDCLNRDDCAGRSRIQVFGESLPFVRMVTKLAILPRE